MGLSAGVSALGFNSPPSKGPTHFTKTHQLVSPTEIVTVMVLHKIRVFQVERSLVGRGRPRKNTCPVVVSVTAPVSQQLEELESLTTRSMGWTSRDGQFIL